MRRALAFVLLLAATQRCLAQILPQPDPANPRLQQVAWAEGREVILTVLPQTGLTVLLEPGEEIRRVSLADERAIEVRVSAERDSLLVLPSAAFEETRLLVQTDRRSYPFRVRAGTGLMAAYLVRFTFEGEQAAQAEAVSLEPAGDTRAWNVKGDRAVRPAAVSDDGVRTMIMFAADQSLPAVLALGPTGEEEVVNGYMRGEVFVIDRVHNELVFRIDNARATARPQARSAGKQEQGQGQGQAQGR